jgi:hypothetical protein
MEPWIVPKDDIEFIKLVDGSKIIETKSIRDIDKIKSLLNIYMELDIKLPKRLVKLYNQLLKSQGNIKGLFNEL